MAEPNYILQELKELESSLQTARNVYQAPAGYFDSLAMGIMARIKALETDNVQEELRFLSPALAQISKKMPYSLPAKYFEILNETALQSIFIDDKDADKEMEILSPLLHGLKKQTPYQAPKGYFDKLNGELPKTERSKLVSLNPVRWMRYAAAVAVIALLSIAGFLALSKKNQVDPDSASYVWVEKSMKKVSTDDIDEFLQLTEENTSMTTTSPAPKEEIKELLKNVSDADIQNFLQDTGIDEAGDDILN